MQLRKVGEFKLIDIIAKQAGPPPSSVIKGIGDDAAVIKTGLKDFLIVTTDLLQEGRHFNCRYTTPYLLGKKCLAVNLSDIAAMGAKPLYYTVSIAAPPNTPCSYITALYRGMHRQARQFSTYLLGGDTSSSRTGISLSITLIGNAPKEHIVYRHGARKGDLIYVTGFLGDAALGLTMLNTFPDISGRHPLIKKHLDPMPRIAEGTTISRAHIANSMIDISDGLVADLHHILKQSGVGAQISLAALPLSGSYRKNCSRLSKDFWAPALGGGEDYELLFTVPPASRTACEKLAAKLKVPVTCIGRITGKPHELVILDKEGKKFSVKREGFTHF